MCGQSSYEEESCIVACPTDCHMSSWSDWGMCDAICGAGLKNRTSKVKSIPQKACHYIGVLNLVVALKVDSVCFVYNY